MSDVVEFIGGPLDGQTRALDYHAHEYRVPLFSPAVWLDDTFTSPRAVAREGRYVRRRAASTFMHWVGER